ncbi:MAG TPA: exonuclease subunit SbcD [Chlorobium sp.]|uniref:Nuclease SbcCD subunit D n=1 Tax=Chlorobium phaeovibrioides (strain DSM 265 / 1930) TaxID=290318 RepID=A4SF88_CHLPM|nr:exonuclease subunit SbcD [Chlorobium sp.]
MKFLHTSDWHLGRSLYGRKRYAEFAAFLDWLGDTIEREYVDALLVAGDVFDTSTPSNRAQELYYRFLNRVARSSCRHVVVIAGNHDSPSFLNAPKELLRALNVYVVGSMTEALEDEVFVLQANDTPEVIVCAVPYLRDKDIRTVEPGETIDDKNAKLVEGLKTHYADVCAIAEQKRAEFKSAGHDGIPIVATGHLFTAGGKTVDGDGVRELYVGSLAHVGEEVFPSSIDYLALGHLHVPQAVGSAEHIRYCGSPIPMGYGEATQEKKVVLVEFNSITPNIQELPVPCFQQLVRIVGSLDNIHAKLEELKTEESSAWLEIEYTGSDIIGNLREMLDEAMADSAMEIRRIKNRRVMERVMSTIAEDETLDDLDAGDVFTRCLDTFEVPDEDRVELTVSYNEIIKDLREEDVNAE